jgi:hypothetical protein
VARAASSHLGGRGAVAAGVTSEDQIGRTALSQMSWRLPPLICLGYGVAHVELSNISFAALHMNQAL